VMEEAATATCDFYIDEGTASDGIPYWDTGAPNLHKLGDWKSSPAEPANEHEPVDSSAAAIAAQGLLRLGRYFHTRDSSAAKRYWQAGLTAANALFDEPYLSTRADHQGLVLHSIYHRPNGWDAVPPGAKVPSGESSMWGDYHARELGIYLQRIIKDQPYHRFFWE
jgi:unsaturated chondroitin disaccharide hydrolase